MISPARGRLNLFTLASMLALFPVSGHAFTQASDQAILVRSPFMQQQTLDSDIRLRGMGFLTLPIDDDSNRIGVFKYGGFFAGLPIDYRGQRKAELSYWHESGDAKDRTTDTKLFDLKEDEWSGMGAFHFGTEHYGEGAVAAGFESLNSKLDAPGAFDDEPGLDQFQIGYGHRWGNLIAGLGVRQADIDIFKQTNSPAHSNVKTNEWAPSVGYIFTPAPENELAVVAGPRFLKEKTDNLFFGHTVQDLDGTGFDAGVNFNSGDVFRGGLYVGTSKINGDLKNNTATIATHETTSNSINLRAYFRPTGSALSFGGLVESSSAKDTQKNTAGATTDDEVVTDLAVGAGAALHLPENRGLVGAELRFLSGKDDDRVSPFVAKNSGYQFSLGGEFAVLPVFILRAGTRYIKQTYTASSFSDQDATQMEVTLGAEAKVGKVGSVALNYVNANIRTDAVTQAGTLTFDKENMNTNSIQLVGRVAFGGTEASNN